MTATCQTTDVAIVGAGPAGLCMARALAGSGLDVLVIDPAPVEALAEPAFDGREIALTHASKRRMEALGLWQKLPGEEISPLRDAWVFDRDDPDPMRISHADGRADQLGFLVANHLIRKAAYEAFRDTAEARLIHGQRVESVSCRDRMQSLLLADGRSIQSRLVIAADGRFSSTRRAFGIAARHRDFGRSMLVCRMSLEKNHDQVAWEWFGRDQTLALLPLNGGQASVVITMPHADTERLRGLPAGEFDVQVTELYQHRLGSMSLVSERCVYPLVGVWPDRLIAPGFAAVGDAAVGMHPVTAHGFNLGLASVESLARHIQLAVHAGRDFASVELLKRYQSEHRRASLPLYLATGAVVGLYTSTSIPARVLRRAALRGANRLAPFRRLLARNLTGH